MLTQARAARVMPRSAVALAVSVARNSRSGVCRRRVQPVRPEIDLRPGALFIPSAELIGHALGLEFARAFVHHAREPSLWFWRPGES